MESDALGSRRSPQAPMTGTNVFDIAAQILPDWEIEMTTNLLLHLRQCHNCLLFIEHVKQNLQGGALSIYLERQRKHWRRMLYDEMRDELSEKYKDGLEEGERNIEMLEDKLDYFHWQVQSLEAENDELGRKLSELSRANDDLRERNRIAKRPIRGEGPRADGRPEKRRRELPISP
jgi:hypothetical protein